VPSDARANALAAPYHQLGYRQLKRKLLATGASDAQLRPCAASAAECARALQLRSFATTACGRPRVRAASLRSE